MGLTITIGTTTMISNKLITSACLVGLLLSRWGFSQAQSLDQPQLDTAPDAANRAANQSLETFRELVTPENAKAYGFEAPGAVASANVGSPVHEAVIGLDSLKKWDGENVESLIKPTGRLIYPIVSKDGISRSSVTLRLKDGEWSPVSFGDSREAHIRSDIRSAIDQNAPAGAPKPQVLQVRVPALNLNFLAQRKDNIVLFTSLQSIPSIDVKAGTTESAKDILTRVQSMAMKVNSDVPN
jgi:hypothetical protein